MVVCGMQQSGSNKIWGFSKRTCIPSLTSTLVSTNYLYGQCLMQFTEKTSQGKTAQGSRLFRVRNSSDSWQ